MSDLLNFVVPTSSTLLAPAAALRVSSHFTGNGSEHGAYIGVPLVLFAILAVVLARRRRVTWVALAVAAGAGSAVAWAPRCMSGATSPICTCRTSCSRSCPSSTTSCPTGSRR